MFYYMVREAKFEIAVLEKTSLQPCVYPDIILI